MQSYGWTDSVSREAVLYSAAIQFTFLQGNPRGGGEVIRFSNHYMQVDHNAVHSTEN